MCWETNSVNIELMNEHKKTIHGSKDRLLKWNIGILFQHAEMVLSQRSTRVDTAKGQETGFRDRIQSKIS